MQNNKMIMLCSVLVLFTVRADAVLLPPISMSVDIGEVNSGIVNDVPLGNGKIYINVLPSGLSLLRNGQGVYSHSNGAIKSSGAVKAFVYWEYSGFACTKTIDIPGPIDVSTCQGKPVTYRNRFGVRTQPGLLNLDIPNLRYSYNYDGVILNGWDANEVSMNLRIYVTAGGKEQQVGGTKYYKVPFTLTDGSWPTDATGVFAQVQTVSCSTQLVGTLSKCTPLRVTYTSGHAISLAAYLPIPPVDCVVRSGGTQLIDQPLSVDTPPPQYIVNEISQDIQMDVKCNKPGTYQIPVVFQRKFK